MDIFSIVEICIQKLNCPSNTPLERFYSKLREYVNNKELSETLYIINEIHDHYKDILRETSIETIVYNTVDDFEYFKEKIYKVAKDVEDNGDESPYYPVTLIAQQRLEQQRKAPIIFLSHSSRDKKYADALRDFIVGLGAKEEQLIYTSHELHRIPLDANIYDYLFQNIHQDVFMLILWSDTYLDSPACLCELGALRVTNGDYTNIYTPKFSTDNPKLRKCPFSQDKFGIKINSDYCRSCMIDLKDKIESFLGLTKNSEKTVSCLVATFLKSVED